MPLITALKPQKNNKRVNVYIDDKFAFGIDLDNLMRFGINAGKEFNTDQINKIIHEAEFQKTFDKLVNFCMIRPRSCFEVFNWLKRKKIHESMNDKLIKRLEKLELLNDEKFAKWWIDQRLVFKNKSIRALKFELAKKGVDKKIIDSLINQSDIDEVKLASNLLEKKAYRWSRLETDERNRKMTEFLMRNGFSWDTIKAALDSFDKKR